jgi:ubiquinol-cytochrome c reductase cytochrome c subunit
MRLAPLVALLLLPPTPVPAHAGTGADARRGEALYGRYCIACHGPRGAGIAEPQPIGAGPLRLQDRQVGLGPSLRGVGERAADLNLRTGYMPLPHIGLQPRRSRVLLSEAAIRKLVAYVGSLGDGPPVPRPHPARGNLAEGLHLFTDHCAGCHQIAARGGYIGSAIAPPLDDATPTQIAEAVRVGPYVMPRFSTKAISDRQLDSIIAYVQYARNPDDRGGWSIGRIGPVPEGLVTWLLAMSALVATCLVIGRRLRA